MLEADAVKPDGEAGTPTVDDHDFAPPEGRPWDRCTRCGYSEAAHLRVPSPYVPTAPRAAPEAKP